MPDHSSRTDPPESRQKRRQLVAWLASIGGCYLLLITAIAIVALANLPGIANAVLASQGGLIGGLSFHGRNLLEVRDAAWRGDSGRVSLERGTVQLRWKDALIPEIAAVRLERPRVVLLSLPSSGGVEAASTTAPTSLQLDEFEIVDGQIIVGIPGAPRIEAQFNLTSPDIAIEGTEVSTGKMALEFTNLKVTAEEEIREPLFTMANLRTELQLANGGNSLHLFDVEARKPMVRLQPEDLENLEALLTDDNGSSNSPTLALTADRLAIENASVELSGFYRRPNWLLPDLAFEADFQAFDLQWNGAEFRSPTPVLAELRHVVVDGGNASSTEGILTRIQAVELEAIPDEFLADGWIDRVDIEQPEIQISFDRMSRFESLWNAAAATVTKSVDPAPPSAASSRFELPLIRVRDFALSGGNAAFDLSGFDAALPRGVATHVSGTSEGEEPGSIRLTFAGIDVQQNADAESKFADADEVDVLLSAEGLQRLNRIDRVEIRQAEIEIGDEVERIAAALTTEPATIIGLEEDSSAGVVDDTIPQWTIGEFSVGDSRLILEDIAPGLPFVPIEISTEIEDVPLEGRTGDDETLQRIELGRVAIKSVRQSLIDIAVLDSIFVDFTLPGLFRSEIEKIEIVSPKLYVGEHLFWYVDDFRADLERAAAEVGVVLPDPEPADSERPEGEPADPSRVGIIEDALRSEVISGWTIKGVDLHAGNIILAPKGVPLRNLPLPFSTSTDFDSGKIDIALKIEPGDYPFPNIDMTVGGLRGEARFNYPLKSKDNNFVQTFEADWIKYKRDFKADGISISVTYDAQGIYGKIWAKAYGGDLNSEFNIYIGETYKWDGWVSAVGVELDRFSNSIIPDTIEAKGRVDLVFVANGDGLEPEKATGNLKVGPGSLYFKTIDDIEASIPDDWAQWERTLANAGLDLFRRYEFGAGEGNLEFKGWNGFAKLLFSGDDGERNLHFNFTSDGNPAIILKEFVERSVIQ
ncbi:MAG: hypothetical protein AAGJ79_02430 [Verrucomicrobiota bacterium]